MIAANVAMARFLKSRRVASAAAGGAHAPSAGTASWPWPRSWTRCCPRSPIREALAGFLARRKAADPEHYPDLSLAIVKLLGPGEYVLERRISRGSDGHFGLAVAEYAHSTAPNRRYADLVTQRLVKGTLDGTHPRVHGRCPGWRIAARCTEREDARAQGGAHGAQERGRGPARRPHRRPASRPSSPARPRRAPTCACCGRRWKGGSCAGTRASTSATPCA